jgi:hypothetical protein
MLRAKLLIYKCSLDTLIEDARRKLGPDRGSGG